MAPLVGKINIRNKMMMDVNPSSALVLGTKASRKCQAGRSAGKSS